MTEFYDSIENVFPDGAEYIVAYTQATPDDVADKYPFVHWITRRGGGLSVDTRSQLLDYEPGCLAFEPDRMHLWAERRHANDLRSIVYCDRADLHSAHAELGVTLFREAYWWIPTLDDGNWNQMSLSADIRDNWDLLIDPDKIWANQYTTKGKTDYSRLFGDW